MDFAEQGINIQFTEKALTFIKTRRLRDPLVLVNMGYRTDSGDQSGCSGGSGCGGGDSGPAMSIPYTNVVLVDGGRPGDDFVRVNTSADVPVYVAKAILKKAKRGGDPLLITLKGLVMKRLSLEGLDLGIPAGQSQGSGGGC